MVIYRPDGQRFLTSVEMQERTEQAQWLLEQERQRAEQERQRAEQERQRALQLAAYLRSLALIPTISLRLLGYSQLA